MYVDCVLASPRIAQVDLGDKPLSEVVLLQYWVVRLMKESHPPPWRDSSVEYSSPPFLIHPPFFFFLLPFFLSSFLLLYSPCGGSIGDFKFSLKI
jgi:hypothetical protein